RRKGMSDNFGISEMDATRYQAVAAAPHSLLAEYREDCAARDREATVEGFVKFVERRRKRQRKLESGQVRILPIEQISPSPENEELYRPVDPDDPQIRELAESIRLNGFTVPMVVCRDYPCSDRRAGYYILSGHRRYAAAELLGLENVPCIIQDVCRWVEGSGSWVINPEFLRLLENYNRQRHKTLDEMMRESVVKADPKDAHRALSDYREKRADEFYGYADPVELRESKKRAAIS